MALYSNNLKLAIQKEGRLTDETLGFLRSSGLSFETYKKRLFSKCLNFPLEILYVRDDDISNYVSQGIVDLGIVGQNLLYEFRPKVKKLLNLMYGFCSLVLAVPKESTITRVSELKNSRVATSYLNSARKFFEKEKVNIELINISGSVEIAPVLGIAAGIIDLVSTGSTLALNDLKIIKKIYDSEAVLITNEKLFNINERRLLIKKLLLRFKAVLSAGNYKYVLMSCPRQALPKIIKIIPCLQFPSIVPSVKTYFVTIQALIKEEMLWDSIDKLRKGGIRQISVLPIEKLIN